MCGITLNAICLVNLLRLGGVADEDVADLLEQLVHPRLARARDRLIGRDDDALDPRGVVQRLERDDHLRGRAIRVGDDVLRAIALDRLRVHLGHDQRHVGVHAVERRIVDHRAARRGEARGVELRAFGADREQRHVPAGGIEMLDVLDLELFPGLAKIDHVALAARRRDDRDLVRGKLALRQDIEHLAPDIARRARDDHPVTHPIIPIFARPPGGACYLGATRQNGSALFLCAAKVRLMPDFPDRRRPRPFPGAGARRRLFRCTGRHAGVRRGDRRDGAASDRGHGQRRRAVRDLGRNRPAIGRRACRDGRSARRAARRDRVRAEHDQPDLRGVARAGARMARGRRADRHPARSRRQCRAVAAGRRGSRHDGALARFRSGDRALVARRSRRAARPEDAAGRARRGEQRARHAQPDRRGLRAGPRERGALTYVDAVQSVPHVVTDVAALGCDFLACSPYKFFGPHQGVLWMREPASAPRAYKVRPAGDDGAHRFETGTPSFEGQAGVLGTIGYLEWLGSEADPAANSRRARLVAAMTAIAAYERELGEHLLAGLRRSPGSSSGARRRWTAASRPSRSPSTGHDSARHRAASRRARHLRLGRAFLRGRGDRPARPGRRGRARSASGYAITAPPKRSTA